MMNYAVIGARGFLGSYLVDELQRAGHSVLATARNIDGCAESATLRWTACDITKPSEVDALVGLLEEPSQWQIFFLAAYHHPDEVEKNPQAAWNTNITALSAFLNKVRGIKRLFYPSTDTVYGEGNLEYRFRECDPTAPVNRYGKHKVLAEQLVLACGYQVVRLPFLIGPSLLPGRPHFCDRIRETLAAGMSIEMFQDSYRSALSFRQTARILTRLSSLEALPPILNIASDDPLSKYDIGRMIAHFYRLPEELVVPIGIRDGAGIYQVRRAATTLLDNHLMKDVLGLHTVQLEIGEGEQSLW